MSDLTIPVDWFVCPVTKEELKKDGAELISSAGRYRKHPELDHWDFRPTIPELKTGDWKTWQHLQDNGCVSYNEDPTKNLGVGDRKDYLQFRDFANLRGRILDIGVGPQTNPTHFQFSPPEKVKEFVGIDPLAGDSPKKFKFVQGLGEFLPFRENFFDQTLFVTSLDHFLKPAVALDAAKRVTKPTGEVCVWIGEKAKNAPRPATSPEWYSRLSVPEGAEDRFHFKRFSLDDFKAMVENINLKTADVEIIKVDEWRSNYFFRLKKLK